MAKDFAEHVAELEEKGEVVEVETVDPVIENVREELNLFVPTSEVEGIDGTKYLIPKVSWKKEKIIFAKVAELFDKVRDSKDHEVINFENITVNEIMQLVSLFLRESPEIVESIVSTILGLTKEQIEENLDSKAIVSLLVPFFSEKLTTFRKVVRGGLKIG